MTVRFKPKVTPAWKPLVGGPWLICLAFALLAAAWTFATPPGGAPDEPEHYVKAAGIEVGDYLGKRPVRLSYYAGSPLKEAHVLTDARAFDLPARKAAPLSWYCTLHHPAYDGSCLVAGGEGTTTSQVARYVPYPYVLPAALGYLGHDAASSLAWMRLGVLVPSIFLLSLAVWSAWDGSPISLVGVCISVSPTCVFLFSNLSPSGPEISGGLCLAAGIVGVKNAPKRPVAWTAAILGALVLTGSKSLGFVWMAAYGVFAAVLFGRERMAGIWNDQRKLAIGVILAAVAGVLASAAWQVAFSPPPGSPGVVFGTIKGLAGGILGATVVVSRGIATFGWDDRDSPYPIMILWFLSVCWLWLLVGKSNLGNEKWAVWGMTLTCLIAMATFQSYLRVSTGFNVQARHLLPLEVGITVFAGDVARRHVRAAYLIPLFLTVGLAQAFAWGFTAATYGGRGWPMASAWTPGVGWALPLALAAASCSLFVAVPVTALLRGKP